MNTTFERQDIGYLLTAYADGQLAPEGVMWVEEQLDRNPDLRAKLKEIRQLQAGLRTAFAGGAPAFVLDLPRRDALLASAANPPRKKILFPSILWIGLAASILVMVTVLPQMGVVREMARMSPAARERMERESRDYLATNEPADGFMPAASAAPTPSSAFGPEQQVQRGLNAQGIDQQDVQSLNYTLAKNDDEVRKLREGEVTRGQNGAMNRADVGGAQGGRGTFGGEKMAEAKAVTEPLAASAPMNQPAPARPSESLAKRERDAAPRQATDERKKVTNTVTAPMSPPVPVASAPPSPTTPAPTGGTLAKADRLERAAAKEQDGKTSLASAAKPAPPVIVGDKVQAFARQNAAPAKPGATGPQTGKDKSIDQLPVELSEADVAAPATQRNLAIQEKTTSEDENAADIARGREEAVTTSETGSTGTFMAIGAGGKGGAERRAIAKKEMAEQRASQPTPQSPADGIGTNAEEERLRHLEQQQQAQLAILKDRYPKLAANDGEAVLDAAVQQEQEKQKVQDSLQQRVARNETHLAALKSRYPKIAAEISDEKQSASFLQGVVGAVRNNPQGQQDVLMLTLGKGDQVEEGTEFIIYRGNQYIVRVQAERVLEGMVACRVISDSWNTNGHMIQNGDLAQNRLGGGDETARPVVAARSLLVASSSVDPQQSLAALRAPVTLDGTLGLAQSLRLIGGEKIGFSLTTGALGFLERQVQVNLRDEAAARGVLRAVRSAGLQAQFTGGVVHLDAATRPLDPADTQGFDLPTFKALFGTSPMQVTAVDAIQTVAIDADTASYEYAKARVAAGQPVDPATIKPEHFINAMPMDYPAAQGAEAFTLYAEAAPSPFARAGTSWGPRTAVVSIGAVAKPAAADERKPLALTLAIDCSGSMAQEGGLDRIQRGLLAFVEHLRAEDRVSIVAFGDQARVVLPATPGNDRAALTNALVNLATGGATNAAEGLGLAYQLAAETAAVGVESRVLLATDGGTVAGADDLLRRVTAFKDRGITLVVVGTGQTYRAGPLQDLATKGDGQHFYVGSDDDAQALFTGKLLPDRLAVLAKDAKLQVTWNPQRVSHARLIGYDQRRLAAKDFRDNTVDAGELSQDTQVTALFEVLLVDGGAGPLGTAAVRYKDMRREQVRELACPLPGTILQSQPSDRLRLLTCAAATAEWLQRGWWSNVHLITPQEIVAQLARCPQPIAHELRAMVK